MSTTNIQLGRALETARKDKGLSKTAAAKELEVSRLTYDMWEREAWTPDIKNVDRIAHFIEAEKVDVFNALARSNGYIDADHYFELKKH